MIAASGPSAEAEPEEITMSDDQTGSNPAEETTVFTPGTFLPPGGPTPDPTAATPPPPGSPAFPPAGGTPPPPSWDQASAAQPSYGYAPPPGGAAYGTPVPPAGYGPPSGAYPMLQPGVPPGYQQKEKTVAGILGILLGAFGVHNFYLGNTGKAVTQLLITVLSCGLLSIISSIWGIVEGIQILTGSINTDANGVPLKG